MGLMVIITVWNLTVVYLKTVVGCFGGLIKLLSYIIPTVLLRCVILNMINDPPQ